MFRRYLIAGGFLSLALTLLAVRRDANADSSIDVPSNQPVVIDADTGRDDAWAILAAFKNLHIVGVVATYGNAPLAMTLRNNLDVVNLGEQIFDTPAHHLQPVDVWEGASHPLDPISPVAKAEIERRAKIAGNGICNVILPVSPRLAVNPAQGWEQDLAHHIKGWGSVNYIVTGPLTDLALLIEKEPDIKNRISNVIVMGGSLDPQSPVDFNFKADPVAAQKVIAAFGDKIILVPFDETRKLKLTEAEAETLRPQDAAAVFDKILILAYARGWSKDHTILFHDPTTLLALEPGAHLVQEKISVIQTGEWAGKTVRDPNGITVRRYVVPADGAEPTRNRLLTKYLGLDFTP